MSAIPNNNSDNFDTFVQKFGVGRTKGLRNKKSNLLLSELKLKGFDCADKIVEIWNDPEITLRDKIKVIFRVLEYTHPKMSPLDPKDIEDDEGNQVPVVSLGVTDIIKIAKGESIEPR
jgi:hypothetical protein